MRLKPDQLSNHLAKGLAGCYMVYGDEPLLQQEICDAIRSKARQEGFLERDLFHVEARFDWQQITASDQAMSLFSSRKIIEIRIPSGKPGKEGSAALSQLVAQPNPDNLVLISSGKIDSKSQTAKWFKALDAAGVCIPIFPLEAAQMGRWIQNRAQSLTLNISPEACQLLAQRTEGNLLATAQELEKFTLNGPNFAITADHIDANVGGLARYSNYQLVDTALAGQASHSLTMLYGLKEEGTNAMEILWVISREIRLLFNLVNHPQGVEAGLKQERVWEKRKGYLRTAAQQHNRHSTQDMLRQCQAIDQCVKGVGNANAWDLLGALIMQLSGHPIR
ncbi:MAG: DNA polymerase III subunit delta [Gammaproteobacteria bacterium]|nr:DNA polymerase III subunit delta [Gammaproteobacteria bacterium]